MGGQGPTPAGILRVKLFDRRRRHPAVSAPANGTAGRLVLAGRRNGSMTAPGWRNGRRTALKMRRGQPRAGSSPAPGTDERRCAPPEPCDAGFSDRTLNLMVVLG